MSSAPLVKCDQKIPKHFKREKNTSFGVAFWRAFEWQTMRQCTAQTQALWGSCPFVSKQEAGKKRECFQSSPAFVHVYTCYSLYFPGPQFPQTHSEGCVGGGSRNLMISKKFTTCTESCPENILVAHSKVGAKPEPHWVHTPASCPSVPS